MSFGYNHGRWTGGRWSWGRRAGLGCAILVTVTGFVQACKFTSCADTNSCADESEGSLGGQGGAPAEGGDRNAGGVGGIPLGDGDCREGELLCDGACVDPLTDPDFCGARGDCSGSRAGAACGDGDVCLDGACRRDCPSGEVDCEGKCIDPRFDADYCGADDACEGFSACNAREQCLLGTCADWEEAQVVDFGSAMTSTIAAGQLGTDEEGELTFAWGRADAYGYIDARTSHFVPEVDVWSVPLVHDTSDQFVTELKMATNMRGKTVLVWLQSSGGFQKVHAVVRDEAGTWGEVALLSGMDAGADEDWSCYSPSVSLDEEGNAYASWYEVRDEQGYVAVTNHLGAEKTEWDGPNDLVFEGAELGVVSDVLLTRTGTDEAIALLLVSNNGDIQWLSATASAGSFDAPAPITGTFFSGPGYALERIVGGNGREAVLLFGYSSAPSAGTVLTYRDGEWSSTQELSGEVTFRQPTLVVDAEGSATAVWVSENGAALLGARRAKETDEWVGFDEPIAVGSSMASPVLAVDGFGNVHLAWNQETAEVSSVWVSRIRTGRESFDSPRIVEEFTEATGGISMAFSPSGQGALTYWVGWSSDRRLGYNLFR